MGRRGQSIRGYAAGLERRRRHRDGRRTGAYHHRAGKLTQIRQGAYVERRRHHRLHHPSGARRRPVRQAIRHAHVQEHRQRLVRQEQDRRRRTDTDRDPRRPEGRGGQGEHQQDQRSRHLPAGYQPAQLLPAGRQQDAGRQEMQDRTVHVSPTPRNTGTAPTSATRTWCSTRKA